MEIGGLFVASGTKAWKHEAEKSFDEICTILNDDRFLDHEIRAVESAITKKLTPESEYGTSYTIQRKRTDSCKWTQINGITFICEEGAQIWYLAEGSRLQKMVTIGHELGHIYLAHLKLEGIRRSDALSKDRYTETQATYFSKLIVKRRAELFKNREYITERQPSLTEINSVIKSFQSDYDEDMLDKELRASSPKDKAPRIR